MNKINDPYLSQEMTCRPIPIHDSNTYKHILNIYRQLQPNIEVLEIYQYYDDSEVEGRLYDVYQITSLDKPFVLKKTNKDEVFVYNTFLNNKDLAVPVNRVLS